MLISSRWENIPTQRDKKQLYINVRRREEMKEKKKKTLEDKSHVYIIRLFNLHFS